MTDGCFLQRGIQAKAYATETQEKSTGPFLRQGEAFLRQDGLKTGSNTTPGPAFRRTKLEITLSGAENHC